MYSGKVLIMFEASNTHTTKNYCKYVQNISILLKKRNLSKRCFAPKYIDVKERGKLEIRDGKQLT